jgi:hypothetical protein
MEVVLTLASGQGWCLRCGRCDALDTTGRCRECSYMAADRDPDAFDQALAEIEAARELAADAGLDDIYAALVEAQRLLGYLGGELEVRCRAIRAEPDYPRAS